MAKELVTPDGQIVLTQSISARDDHGPPIRIRSAYYAVSPEATFARPKRNVVATRAVDRLTTNDKNVARENRGNHARAVCDKSKLARRPQDLRCQFQFERFSTLGGCFHCSLRVLSIETALRLGRVQLAASQRHRLEDPLVLERRLLVRLLRLAALQRRLLRFRGLAATLVAHCNPAWVNLTAVFVLMVVK
jgi:hypothetical protein